MLSKLFMLYHELFEHKLTYSMHFCAWQRESRAATNDFFQQQKSIIINELLLIIN